MGGTIRKVANFVDTVGQGTSSIIIHSVSTFITPSGLASAVSVSQWPPASVTGHRISGIIQTISRSIKMIEEVTCLGLSSVVLGRQRQVSEL